VRIAAIMIILLGVAALVDIVASAVSVIQDPDRSEPYKAAATVILALLAVWSAFLIRAGVRAWRGGRRNLASSIVLRSPVALFGLDGWLEALAFVPYPLAIVVLLCLPTSQAWIKAHAFPLRKKPGAAADTPAKVA
jgi:hypothetical protein